MGWLPEGNHLRLLLVGNRAALLASLGRHNHPDRAFREAVELAETGRRATPATGHHQVQAASTPPQRNSVSEKSVDWSERRLAARQSDSLGLRTRPAAADQDAFGHRSEGSALGIYDEVIDTGLFQLLRQFDRAAP